MLEFVWPWAFAALPIPWLVHRYMPPATNRAAALKVPFYEQLKHFGYSGAVRASRLRWVLAVLLWVCLVTAFARPQWLGEATDVPLSGRDLILAIDISGSMQAEDMLADGHAESRLTTVKRVAGEFISRRQGDRVALVLFGTRAYLHAPLSFDLRTINTLLQESEIGLAGEKTAIGDAIGLAVKRASGYAPGSPQSDDAGDRVLVLLTDGANTSGNLTPQKSSELARQTGLKIHTIGIGAESVAVNSLFGPQLRANTELDERLLKQLARITGGEYFRATDAGALARIYDLIDQLEPTVSDARKRRPIRSIYHYPLTLSALFAFWLALVESGLPAVLLRGLRAVNGALPGRFTPR